MALADISVMDSGAGWINQAAGLGTNTGYWDLGPRGLVTLGIPNEPSASPGAYKLLRLQVVDFRSTFHQIESVAITTPPGAVRVSTAERVVNSQPALGDWVWRLEVWRLPMCPAQEIISIQGGPNGCILDQIVVDTLCVSAQTLCQASNIVGQADLGQCSKSNVTFQVPTADGCIITAVQCSHVSGSTFPVGNTPVTCLIYEAGQPQPINCSFTVTILDTQPPTLAGCPGNLVVNTDPGQCTATVNYTVTPIDNCPSSVSVTCSPSSKIFGRGTTSVICTAMDGAGNTSGACSFTVTVNDNQPPAFQNCVTRAVNAPPNGCSATVDYTVIAIDSCDGVVSVNCTPPGGSLFNVGTSTVNCTAADSGQRTATCTFAVIVSDTTAPVATCPSDLSLPAPGVAQYAASVTDNCPGASITCLPPSGSFFPSGTHPVTCTAQDASANQAQCTFQVVVAGTTNCVSITCPSGVLANTCSNSAVVTYQVNATNHCGGTLTVQCQPSSGNNFPLGQTPVSCEARDNAGNLASCTFMVTVIGDTAAPTITCPSSLTLDTDPGQCSRSNVTYSVTAADNCPNSLAPVVCAPPSGSPFPVGPTPVVCSVRDGAGNSNSCTFTVTVLDREVPRVTCPPSLTLDTDPGQCSRSNVTFSVTATDNCPNSLAPVVCAPPSGSPFPLGSTPVVCSVRDGAGNSNSCTFTVTIGDREVPRVTCPPSLTLDTDPGQCSRSNVTFSVTATDNCPNSLAPVVCAPPSGSPFPLGPTPVMCSVRDGAGNSNSCTFTVTISDREVPRPTCPTSFTALADAGKCSKSNVTFNATATDNCASATIRCEPSSGSTFPLGQTTVTCTATDSAGNSSTCTFTLTIRDLEPPSVVCPPNQLVQATSPNGAAVIYPPATVSDNCSASLTATCLPASGSTFPLGTNLVTCTATDTNGNQAQCNFQIVVVPASNCVSIVCPQDIQASTCGNSAVVTYQVHATNHCGGTLTVQCDPPSGFAFPLGANPVSCVAFDSLGNLARCSFTVTVIGDTEGPRITCPSTLTLNTDPGQCTRSNVTFSVTATDNCPNSLGPVVCDPASGATLSLGPTIVVCTVRDGAGNSANCFFTVNVQDREPPRPTCPANLTGVTDQGTCSKSNVTFSATATDNCTGVVTVRCEPQSGSPFPRGTNVVTCTATDVRGNSSNCTFTVTIRDAEPPSVQCPADRFAQASSPNGVPVTYPPATVTDNCDTTLAATCLPPSGSTFPLGTNVVTCAATDSSGNQAQCTFKIVVTLAIDCVSIVCPQNLQATTCSNSAVVTYQVNATNRCGGTLTVQCEPSSGFAFPVGASPVSCVAFDSLGNLARCTFTVTVTGDTEGPRITCPLEINGVADAGQCSKSNVDFTLTVSDNCPGVTSGCVPASGSTFPVGSTNVTCTATDASGRQSSCTFKVTIRDLEPPRVTCPKNFTALTDRGLCSKTNVTFGTSASDNCQLVSFLCTPPSGSTFPRGTSTVSCTAADNSGNSNGCTFTVTIQDLEAPIVQCPPDRLVQASSPNGLPVTYPPATVTDNCDTGLTATCMPPSGSTFPLGTNVVTCAATDTSGNASQCTFKIVVTSATDCVSIICPQNIQATTCGNSAVVTYQVNATNRCGTSLTVECQPPSGFAFPVGFSPVSCVAFESLGNIARCTFTVTVIGDTEPPRITCPPTLTVLAYARTGAVVNYPTLSVSDNCAVASVVCQPPSGSVFPLGNSPVQCVVTDASGNTSSCTFAVQVSLIGLELDRFDYSLARLTFLMPNGAQETVTLAGPTEVEVIIGDFGQATDFDGNGREQALAEMKRLDLAGRSSLGPMQLRLQAAPPTTGQIEELANSSVGRLDVRPFAKSGLADSFFDVWFEVQVGATRLRNAQAMRMAAVLSHKPPAVGEAYTNTAPVELVDPLGNPTGIRLVRVEHVPEPPKEVDEFPNSEAFLTVRSVTGAQPLSFFLRGPSTVEVTIPPSGWAADTDADGNDQAPARMTQLELRGEHPTVGPVVLKLGTNAPTLGGVEERSNPTLGTLDVPPFVTSPSGLLADSFFDVFFEVTVGAVGTLHPAAPVHMQAVLTHKPPAPGEAFTNSPAQGPIRLLYPNGTPSEFELVRVIHVPIPTQTPCPKLTVTIDRTGAAPMLRVCWPGPRRDCVLQSAPSLNPPVAWETVPTPPEPQPDGTLCVRLPYDGKMRYFRLCSGCFGVPAP